MSFTTISYLLAYGLLLAGIYILISVGLTLIFGVMEVINLAHGAFVMIGGYLALVLFKYAGIGPFLSLPIIILVTFGIGYLVQLGLVERVLGEEELYSVLLTFGFALFVEGALRHLFTSDSQTIPALTSQLPFFGLPISWGTFAAGITGWVFTGLLAVFLSKSMYGQAIRATSQAPRLAEACGIRSRRIRALTFGIGTLLAGIGGVAYLLLFTINPVGGRYILLIAFIIVVFGGMGSVLGTGIAGVVIALTQVFIAYYIGGQEALAIMYLLLLMVLLVKPHGLFGQLEGRYA